MIYKAQIHKRKIYITPRPKEDIEGGLIVMLNKASDDKLEPFIKTDIRAGEKEYSLPELPDGVWVLKVFVKNGKRDRN